MAITTIQLDEKVKGRLDLLKMHHRETYNELISRMILGASAKIVNRESLIATIEILSDPKTMRDIARALEEYQKGKGKTLEKIEEEIRL